MYITDDIIKKSVSQQLFGTTEPFITGDEQTVARFYERVFADLKKQPKLSIIRELDHHGSGYASYISIFVYPRDGSSRTEFPDYFETHGLLVYVSRLAPIAVFGASSRTESKNKKSSGSGFIDVNDAKNLNRLPDGNWTDFFRTIEDVLNNHGVEILAREPLLLPAPKDVEIPTVFDGPYYVFDTLFYWSD